MMSSTAITTTIMYGVDDDSEKYEDTPLSKWISRIFKDPGNCEDCNEPELQPFWCHNCNSERFTRNFNNWTSGHRTLDYLISEVQLAAVYFSQVIEWIPYDRFRNVSFIGSGGYANTHKAVWLDGPILSWDSKKKQWYRAKNSTVALKVLHHTRSNICDDFIKEIWTHTLCGMGKLINIYGFSQDPNTKDYILVLDYASNGNIRQFLRRHHNNNDNSSKLKLTIKIMKEIGEALQLVHAIGSTHRNLHPGNILINSIGSAYIADLGSSTPPNETSQSSSSLLSTTTTTAIEKKKLYGVLPYVAPEVLCGKQHTSKSDIYSYGMVMWELLTNQPPFNKYGHNLELAISICRGFRPASYKTNDLPDSIIKLMNSCWDNNSKKRPDAQEIIRRLKDIQCELWGEEYYANLDDEQRHYSSSEGASNGGGGGVNHTEAIYTSRILPIITPKLMNKSWV